MKPLNNDLTEGDGVSVRGGEVYAQDYRVSRVTTVREAHNHETKQGRLFKSKNARGLLVEGVRFKLSMHLQANVHGRSARGLGFEI